MRGIYPFVQSRQHNQRPLVPHPVPGFHENMHGKLRPVQGRRSVGRSLRLGLRGCAWNNPLESQRQSKQGNQSSGHAFCCHKPSTERLAWPVPCVNRCGHPFRLAFACSPYQFVLFLPIINKIVFQQEKWEQNMTFGCYHQKLR